MRQPSIQKIFINLSIGTAIFFVLIGSILLTSTNKGTFFKLDLFSENKLSVSTSNLISVINTEIPLLNRSNSEDNTSISKGFTNDFNLFNFITFTPDGPDSWLRQEIPVFSYRRIDGTSNNIDIPVENMPSEEFFKSEVDQVAQPEPNEPAVPVTTGDKNVVFIYHTHNRESFLPELETKKMNESFHPTKNITMVGKQLAEELKDLGIGTTVSSKDYWPELEPGTYYLSYKHSLKTVSSALQGNRDIKYIFDIHRDAQPGGKAKTTAKINGKDYGRIFFVIGAGNKNYEQNKEFALKINNRLEELYPGLSKGIIERQVTSGTNGEYNQSVSPYALTIEIGGVYNSLEEEYRSVRALAEAIADVYWQAEKVDAQPN